MTEDRRSKTEDQLSSALRHVKPRIRALKAYTLKHHDPPIKLNQNESPFDVPAELKAALWERLASRPWNRYPPFVATDFISAISEATGWPTDGILVGNGSNELIQALLATVVEPGVSVVITEPTFTLYRLMTGVGGGTVAEVSMDSEFRFPVDEIVKTAQTSRAAVVVLCAPNNPTGSGLSREAIERIHDETESLIVLDQAYVEFGGFDAIPLLEGRPRLIILRTYSKAMSLAGLRAGYLLGNEDLVTEISKAKLPYNLNFVTESVSAELMRNRHLLQPNVDALRIERDRIYAGLQALEGVRVFPSEANFLLFRVEHPDLDEKVVFNRLLDEFGVLVRDVSGYPMLERCLRVNAGTREENDVLLEGLRTIFARS